MKGGENQKSMKSQESRKILNDLNRLDMSVTSTTLKVNQGKKAYPTENFDNHWYFGPALKFSLYHPSHL